MAMEIITLSRDCESIEIPSGTKGVLPSGTGVRVMQFLGSSWTVTSAHGMFRIDVKDADALGLTPPAAAAPAQGGPTGQEAAFNEKMVWDQLKTVFDPRDTGKYRRS